MCDRARGSPGGGSAVDRGREDFSLYFYFFFYSLMLTSVPANGRRALASASTPQRVNCIVAANEFCSKQERENERRGWGGRVLRYANRIYSGSGAASPVNTAAAECAGS